MRNNLILGICGLLLLCACTAPSESAVQTAIAQTEEAQAAISESAVQTAIAKTQTAEKAVESTPTAISPTPTEEKDLDCGLSTDFNEQWPIAFCDTFSDNRNGWDLGRDSDDLARSIYSIENGKLVVDLTGKATTGYLSGVIQWLPVVSADDFVLTIKGNIESNYKSCSWGVVFNEKDWNNFYAFMISSREGWYYLTMYDQGEQKFPISGRSHDSIIWDAENELTIIAEDGYYQFYINGVFVNDYETRSAAGSRISLATWTAEGVTARFEFDDLLIKAPFFFNELVAYEPF